MLKSYCLIIVIVICCNIQSVAQQTMLLSKTNLIAYNRNVSTTDNNGKVIVHLDDKAGNGIAWIKGTTFKKGTIELDVKGKDVMQQSFVGIAFHGTSDSSYDCVYFRPFNFNAPDAMRKKHSVQYISMPQFDWSHLRAKYPGKYENALTKSIDADSWFHAKIVVEANKIAVFVNGDDKPSLTVKPLNDYKSGKIGFWTGNYSDGSFSNLSIKTK